MNDAPFPRDASEIRMAVQRLARRLRSERAVETMSDGQLAVLAWLARDTSLTLSELADRERVSAPSMNRTVNCLEDAGYLVRTPDSDDRRRVNITLTDTGAEIIRETARRRDAWFDDILDALSDEDRETLRAAATIMRRAADQ